ncbi:MAG: hypothetical protein ACD_2C00079G0006 [uncultured bacterium (gcode 4)]|uniref:DUF4268 domain-containing protein n=1 Tax=uncultured bacterium (gcode 4) TaxID=1234023 RepID=K2GHG1_9BACT|nr:MAG: hypothetical protein ACD_2C00079G0006 [uncultured bacterium (gcode 4)]
MGKNIEGKKENKDSISAKKTLDKNTLEERLSQTKKWFDYNVTPDKKFRLIYNWHELIVDIKSGEHLVQTAQMVKDFLDDYKKHWFDKEFPKFYEKSSLDWFGASLNVDNNLVFADYNVSQGDWISKKMWSNLDTSNEHFAKNVRWKMEYNTKALAKFLNEIVKEFQ